MTEKEILDISEKIISNNDFAVIGTISKKRFPNIYALKLMKKDGLKKFYFSTKLNSNKINQIKKYKKGCIYFYDMITFTFNNVLIEGIYKIDPKSAYGVSNFYDMESNQEDLCTIIFESKKLYLYMSNKKYIVDFSKIKE